MRLLVLAACVALSVALLGPSGAEAKGTSYLLSGGALGTSAALLPGFIPDRDGTEWAPNVEGTAVAAPHELPSLSYDLYLRYGVMAVPHQIDRKSVV